MTSTSGFGNVYRTTYATGRQTTAIFTTTTDLDRRSKQP